MLKKKNSKYCFLYLFQIPHRSQGMIANEEIPHAFSNFPDDGAKADFINFFS